MISYRIRPAYHSAELLIEFTKGPEKDRFLPELTRALKGLEIKAQSVQDLWMNDEQVITFDSNKGTFILSIDVWGLAFITSKDSQHLILSIDTILANDSCFSKEMVDFAY